jgi:hypothetical protein
MKSILVSISKIVLKILPFFLFLGCNSQKEIGLVKFEDPIIDDSEINFREREIFFPLFLDSLKGELRKGKLPIFLLDECLDMKYPYELTSHTFISTRYMLFEQLTERELKRLFKLSKEYDLSKICSRNAFYVLMTGCKTNDQIENSKKSTLCLLQERIERLK